MLTTMPTWPAPRKTGHWHPNGLPQAGTLQMYCCFSVLRVESIVCEPSWEGDSRGKPTDGSLQDPPIHFPLWSGCVSLLCHCDKSQLSVELNSESYESFQQISKCGSGLGNLQLYKWNSFECGREKTYKMTNSWVPPSNCLSSSGRAGRVWLARNQ